MGISDTAYAQYSYAKKALGKKNRMAMRCEGHWIFTYNKY